MAEQLDLLTSSAAVSPARTSAPPDPAPDSTAPDRGCGSKCSESCEKCGPLGSLLKTSLRSELAALTGCSMTWRRADTPLGRSWWVLTTSADPIDENASGSSPDEWPTPTVTAYGSSNNGCPGDGRTEFATKGKPSLQAMAVRLWPTATATATAGDCKASGSRTTADSKAHAGISLTDAAVHELTINETARRVLPVANGRSTPTLRDWKDTPGMTDRDPAFHGGALLPMQVFAGQREEENPSTIGKPPEPHRILNASWVFQLMGYQATWARLSTKHVSKLPETLSVLSFQRRSDERSCGSDQEGRQARFVDVAGIDEDAGDSPV